MASPTTSRRKLAQEPDEFLGLSHRVWLWVHEHPRRTAAWAAAAAAAVLLVVFARQLVERSHERRTAAVAAAVERYRDGGDREAALAELGELARRHEGTLDGSVAAWFLAGAAADDGDAARGADLYGSAAAGAAGLADLADVARAYLDLDRGEAEAALAAFREIAAREGVAVPRAQLRLEAAGLLERLGRIEEARRAYEGLVADYPDTDWSAAAAGRLERLGAPAGEAA